MAMDVLNLSIDRLLNIQNEQYIIPVYQRRYTWGEKQLRELFNDINFLKDDEHNEDVHHFGMIVIHNREDQNGNLVRLDVIDGQQRLTTLQILLRSLENKYKTIINKNERQTRIAATISNLTSIYDRHNHRTINKLKLGNMDENDFEIIMSNNTNIVEFQNKKLKNAKVFFDDRINQLYLTNPVSLDSFSEKVIYRTYLVKITFKNIEDAFKQFEYINDRGLSLSETDKIKNFLLGNAARLDDETLRQINHIWSNSITNIDNIDHKPDEFFRRFLCSLLRKKVSNNQLSKEFKKFYIEKILNQNIIENPLKDDNDDDDTNDDTEFIQEIPAVEINDLPARMIEFVQNMYNSSIAYNQLVKSDFNDIQLKIEVENLNSIECSPSYIFLIQFIQKNFSNNVKRNGIKLISTLALRRQICKERTGDTDLIFSNLVKILDNVTEENLIHRLKEAIINQGKYPSDDRFREEFKNYDFSRSKNRARLILEYYNQWLLNNEIINLEFRVLGPNQVNIEHIIPQSIGIDNHNGAIWQDYLGNNTQYHHNNIWKIGNLTLLNGIINREAQNSPWDFKRALYRESTLAITNRLSLFENFMYQDAEVRTHEITNFAVNYWRID
jgi:uncharacterized protein with ParB-like and HNH nuclease domain